VQPDDHGPGADLLATVPDAVCHLDRSWRFTYLNAAAAQLLGRPTEILTGRPLQECFPALVGSALEQRLT
jgi:PAS domain-containing protein